MWITWPHPLLLGWVASLGFNFTLVLTICTPLPTLHLVSHLETTCQGERGSNPASSRPSSVQVLRYDA